MTPPPRPDRSWLPSPAWLGTASRLGSADEPRFVWLLAALVATSLAVMLGVRRLGGDAASLELVFSAAVLVVALATIPLLPSRLVVRVLHFVLAGGAMLAVWVGPHVGPVVDAATRLSVVLFFTSVAVWTVWHLMRAERVTTETLVGAVSGYLLLGIAFAFLFEAVETLQPGAHNLGSVGDAVSPVFPDIFYFSFVTLTTIGYGDVSPASDGARLLAIVEGVTGQFYIAAVVARLVSLFVAAPRQTIE